MTGEVTGSDLARWLEEERRLTNQLRRQAEVDTAALNRWRALANDLAAVLSEFADDWLGEDCEGPVSRVLARYREARK